MTLEELVNAIFDDFVQQAEDDQAGSVELKWYEELRQKWLEEIRET